MTNNGHAQAGACLCDGTVGQWSTVKTLAYPVQQAAAQAGADRSWVSQLRNIPGSTAACQD